MQSLSKLKEAVAGFLERSALAAAVPGVGVVCEYPPGGRGFPANAPVVVVGVESVEIEGGALGGYYGDASDGSGGLYGSTAVVTISLPVYVPQSMGAGALHEVYEALCDALVLGNCPYGFFRMWCSGVAYDRDSMSHRLQAHASLRAAVTRTSADLRFDEFDVRKESGQ